MRQLHAWLPLLRLWAAAACALIIITPAASALPQQEAAPGPDATEVGGPLAENTTWSRGASPFVVSASVLVQEGVTLTVEPGVEVRFADSTALIVNGALKAVGTATEPITFTGAVTQPGWWEGIVVGDFPSASIELEHASVAYGGQILANIVVGGGQAHITRSTISHSAKDGVYLTPNSGGAVITASRLTANGEYAVRNTAASRSVLAANNWWGAPSGPTFPDDGLVDCNPSGAGASISRGVIFRPFLTTPEALPAPTTATDERLLVLTPQRWLAPADEAARIPIEVSLYDGAGQPLPGRKVALSASLGAIDESVTTDVRGQAFAFLSSAQPGTAVVTGALDLAESCEAARSAPVQVTFSADDPDGELIVDPEAPYLNTDIVIDPEPITRGTPTTLSTTIENPHDFPIVVEGSFGYAQAGIGQVFGPIGTAQTRTIPAGGSALFSTAWTPVVSGYFCVEFSYSVRRANGAMLAQAGGRSTRNLNIYGGPLGSASEKGILDKAAKFIGMIAGRADKSIQLQTKAAVALTNWQFDMAREIDRNLGGDPPRLDYTLLEVAQVAPPPRVQPDATLSPALAEAYNELLAAMALATAHGRAALVSLDRYGGASQAGDLEWASKQAGALIYHKREYGFATLAVAREIDELLALQTSEGVAEIEITADEVREFQARLRQEGFPAAELAAARQMGMSDNEIEAVRQRLIAADPEQSAGSYSAYLREVSNINRKLGAILVEPPNYQPGGSTGGGGILAEAPNSLVRIFETVTTIVVRNPLERPATIDLRARRVSLPPDWVVSVSPPRPTLEPGQEITVTVTIRAGAPLPQGVQPRVAIEGYAGELLVGGIALDVIAPLQADFDGRLRAYLPLVRR